MTVEQLAYAIAASLPEGIDPLDGDYAPKFIRAHAGGPTQPTKDALALHFTTEGGQMWQLTLTPITRRPRPEVAR